MTAIMAGEAKGAAMTTIKSAPDGGGDRGGDENSGAGKEALDDPSIASERSLTSAGSASVGVSASVFVSERSLTARGAASEGRTDEVSANAAGPGWAAVVVDRAGASRRRALHLRPALRWRFPRRVSPSPAEGGDMAKDARKLELWRDVEDGLKGRSRQYALMIAARRVGSQTHACRRQEG